MDRQELFWFLVSLITVLVGAVLGRSKGRVGDGVMLSLFFGPLGWPMISAKPDLRCPECRRGAEEGSRRCQHCGCQLAGVRD